MIVSLIVGNMEDGVTGCPGLWFAYIERPDTSMWFKSLSDLERQLERDRPHRDSTVYLDGMRNVHVVSAARRDTKITKDGRYRDPKLSPDGHSVGVLVLENVSRPGATTYEPIEVAAELRIYRGGRPVWSIRPGFIRAWDFANDGAAVAIYSGALHFSGHYTLYDIDRDLELERATDPVTDASPEWVRRLSP